MAPCFQVTLHDDDFLFFIKSSKKRLVNIIFLTLFFLYIQSFAANLIFTARAKLELMLKR